MRNFLSQIVGKSLRSRKSMCFAFYIFALKIFRRLVRPESQKLVDRHIMASNLPVNVLKVVGELPQIEVLITAAHKELNFINLVIQSTLKHSLNPIKQVTIVVPRSSMADFLSIVSTSSYQAVPIHIKDESEILGHQLSYDLSARFGNRSGWSKAEFIKLIYVSLSSEQGVLVVDADTLFLHPRVWINSELKQVITPVQEHHGVYFHLYKFLGLPMAFEDISFMSHYQLFQPGILNEAFRVVANSDINLLFRKISEFVPITENSPFCICYEMYAHYLLSEYRSLACQEKWANRAINRDKVIALKNFESIEKKYKRYSSISCHGYLN
jgi:hypothetical protein